MPTCSNSQSGLSSGRNSGESNVLRPCLSRLPPSPSAASHGCGHGDNAVARTRSPSGRLPWRPSEGRYCSPGSGGSLRKRCEQMPSVLVTGAGRGIGLAITEHMSRRGWNVYATARSDAALNSLDRLPNVHAIALDITDRSAIAALPDQLPAELNGVVNNAGIIVNGPVEGLSLDDLTQQLDINVISQIAVTQTVLPKIRNVRGRVVFMSSVSGLFTTPGTGAYNASKYAIESLADALRMELRPWRIPVSLIEPGPIRTDMWADALDDYDHMTKQLSDEHRRLYASHLAGC